MMCSHGIYFDKYLLKIYCMEDTLMCAPWGKTWYLCIRQCVGGKERLLDSTLLLLVQLWAIHLTSISLCFKSIA